MFQRGYEDAKGDGSKEKLSRIQNRTRLVEGYREIVKVPYRFLKSHFKRDLNEPGFSADKRRFVVISSLFFCLVVHYILIIN